MGFGKRLAEARKRKGLSQNEVAAALATKAPVISRYERDEAKPGIEAAANLARLLDTSLDYLVGNTDQELDPTTVKRITELDNLPQNDRDRLYHFIDMAIRDSKTQQAYAVK